MNLKQNFELEMYYIKTSTSDLNKNSTRNEFRTKFWVRNVLRKNLVQVIGLKILLGMNLEQNFELEMYYAKT